MTQTLSPISRFDRPAPLTVPGVAPKVLVRDFSAAFGSSLVLKRINLEIQPRQRLAIIGPASSGKSTFLRSLNRLNDLSHGFTHTGSILLDGQDIHSPQMDVAILRRRIGMVYAVPVPLPWNVYDNIAYGPRLAGIRNRSRLDQLVESA